MRRRAATTALIEKQHIVELGIKQAAMVGRNSTTRAAVQEHRRLTSCCARTLVIDEMPGADIEHTCLVRLDRRVKRTQEGHREGHRS